MKTKKLNKRKESDELIFLLDLVYHDSKNLLEYFPKTTEIHKVIKRRIRLVNKYKKKFKA